MPNRPKDFSVTAPSANSDDYLILDGLTGGTRKWLAANLGGVNSITASASTPLTLTGGSTGASLVLGATGSGIATLTGGVGGKLAIGTTTNVAAYQLQVYGATSANVLSANGVTPDGTKTGGSFTTVLGGTGSATGSYALAGDIAGRFVANTYGNNFIYEAGAIQSTITTGGNTDRNLHVAALDFQTKPTASNVVATVARLTGTGNLLINTQTDAANLSGGLIVNGSGAGAAASSTTTGALRVTGGVGVSGAGYFGGALIAQGDGTFNSVRTSTGGNSSAYVANPTFGTAPSGTDPSYQMGLKFGTTGAAQFWRYTGTHQTADLTWATTGLFTFSKALAVTDTTPASSSIVGALTIGNGTAATNVAIGGGNINAGGSLHQFGTSAFTTGLNLVGSTSEVLSFYDNTTQRGRIGSTGSGVFVLGSVTAENVQIFSGNVKRVEIDGTTGAATFAGAVSLSTAGTTISIKSGTNAAAGTVTLVGGTATITSTAIDVNTVIVMSVKTSGGTIGDHTPSVKVNAGNAVITGSSSDTSTYNWVALKVN